METKLNKAKSLAAKLDEKIGKMQGYTSTRLTGWLESLLAGKSVEIGWRASCGSTDLTHKIYREWCRVEKALVAAGYRIDKQPVKHGNGWATKGGGFWNSSIYSVAA